MGTTIMNTTEITTSNETSAFNQNNSIYFIEPQTDPELKDCHGFELKTELQVGVFFQDTLYFYCKVENCFQSESVLLPEKFSG